ncbi:peptidoglycan DD-metalloendopeptidase family protein [bacterium]|nr:peptidoglycan DD-metalloendopeptidase family protein [bacterium]
MNVPFTVPPKPEDSSLFEPEGIYLAAPFQARYRLLQAWGENPDRYSRFRIAGVPLRGHNGIDFDLPSGTAVLATADGQVLEVGEDQNGYGRFLVLAHWWGESLYAHLQSVQVACGARVEIGHRLGSAGATGMCESPHLHLGIRIAPYNRLDGWGGYVNPLPFLDPAAIIVPSRRPF